LIAEAIEEQLVQNHGAHRNQLLALEPVHDENRGGSVIQLRELFFYQVEALDGASVVVLVVADDEMLRHTLDTGWIAAQWLHCIGHR